MRSVSPAALTACLAAVAWCGCGKGPVYARGKLRFEADARVAAANPVTVSPLPGTVDASPATQISFLGARGIRISEVRVIGSRTGTHVGRLRGFATGTGASFLPARPFLPGERVAVDALVRQRTSTRRAATSFTIATPATVNQSEFPLLAGDARAVQRFRSAPQINPSTVTVTTGPASGATPGYLFLAPYQGDGAPGPMIVDQRGQLVWFRPLPAGEQATNLGVQSYRGRPALVWWQGRIIQVGFGEGEDVVYDRSYRRVASIKAGNGYQADLHAIKISAHGTAWLDAFAPVEVDLSAVNGPPRAVVLDSVVQEIDIDTGLVMWEWHALGHLPPAESQVPLAEGSYPWDYAHINSIDPRSPGEVLLSARSTSTIYDVDVHSGRIRWRVGGRSSSLAIGAGAGFYWQHDSELQPGGLISLFDNGSEPPREHQSRGLLLRVDPASRSVSLVREFANPAHVLLSPSQGSMRRLDGGNWLLGYGRLPELTEFGPDGRVLLDASLGSNVQNYSASLSRWEARPLTRPALVASRLPGARLAASMSWNGATEVAGWRLLGGSSPRRLVALATAPRTGFETQILARFSGRYVSVQALDRTGAVIGASRVLQV
ncbi:MAG TPA: arylsulfotransferase family protein [Solirubrobacteraceae bacterium]|nr:arylsulfotransferase family protein [Solirubrobacteraceae bacterium]